jgi:hypothetical protein
MAATLDDVRRLAMSMPETSERESRANAQWLVKGKLFVWERPLSKADLRALEGVVPTGIVLGAMVDGLEEKEALLQGEARIFFTTPHFDGYAAVLARLENLTTRRLSELIVDAWLARAPTKLVDAYLHDMRRVLDTKGTR